MISSVALIFVVVILQTTRANAAVAIHHQTQELGPLSAPGEMAVDENSQARVVRQPVKEEIPEEAKFRFADNPDVSQLQKRGCCSCGDHHCCGSMCHGK